MKSRRRPKPKWPAKLRAQAEALLGQKQLDRPRRATLDLRRIVHELQIHQVELEMQNEELQRAQTETTAARDEYASLYDFAPVGYMTLDRKATILQANLTVAKLLGVERERMTGTKFTRFVARESQDALYLHQRAAAEISTQLTCELLLRRADGSNFPAKLETLCRKATAATAAHFRCVISDITDQRAAEIQLKESSQQLLALSQRLVKSQETERQHISRELHDQVGQDLTAIQISLQSALALPSLTNTRAQLKECLQLVDALTEQIQDLSFSLRPALLDDFGLLPALRWLADHHKGRAGLQVKFQGDPLERRLDSAIETACFRIAQEALTNILRHARATEASVKLRCEESSPPLCLEVRDNGAGFDIAKARGRGGGSPALGLLSMQERATLAGGRLEISSQPGRGTVVLARFPLRWRSPQPASSAKLLPD